MLVARAFVWSVSPRALLAVLALSLSVAYALVSAGSLAGLGTESVTVETAQAEPGWILHREGAAFDASLAPADARLVHSAVVNGTLVATIDPYPHATDEALLGPYAATPRDPRILQDLNTSRQGFPYAPLDHVLVPPDRFDQLAPDARQQALYAYVAGDTRPATTLQEDPWQGVALFYEAGADQVRQGLVFVVLTSGAIAALLAAGFAHLEVLAKRPDLATLEALAGPRYVRRVVTWRIVALVAAGLVVGTLASLAVMRVAQVAVGTDAFRITLQTLVATWAAAGTGGIVFGVLAGRKALHGDHRTRQGTKGGLARRFRAPGPLRFLIVTPRLFAAVFAATLVAGLILTVVIASSAVPTELFGGDEDETVVVRASGNPLRGTADRFLAENARFLDGVAAAMPETYAPTTHQGRPLLVKGTDFTAWRAYASPALVEGSWPDQPGEATVGSRAARNLGLDVGDRILLPASYHRGAIPVTVLGIHHTGGFADDELYTDLDTAGHLAGLPPDQVTLIRVRLADPTVPWSAIQPREGIEIVQITLDPPNPPPFTPATVTVQALNFADRNETRSIAVRVNGNVTAQDLLRLGPHDGTTTRYPILTPADQVFRLEVNPVREVPAGQAALTVEAPERAPPDQVFQVRVLGPGGDPVPDAEVLVDGQGVARTQSNGVAFLRIPQPGLYVVSARTPEASGGLQVRVAPLDWSDRAELRIERLFLERPAPHDDTQYRVVAQATLVNLGGAPAETTLTWQLDGENTTRTTTITLPSASRTTVQTAFIVPFGDHTVTLLDTTDSVTFTRQDAQEAREDDTPRTIEEVLEEKRRRAEQEGTPADATRSFLDKVFESLESAVVLVVVATVVHSGALVWVAVVREVRERQAVVRQLDALGAAAHQVETRALRDTAISTLPAILSAVVLGGLLLDAGRFLGFPAAFGHALPTGGAVGVLLRTGLTLLVVALAAAFYAVQSARRRDRTRPADTEPREADWVEALA